jgi:hypothetical protein
MGRRKRKGEGRKRGEEQERGRKRKGGGGRGMGGGGEEEERGRRKRKGGGGKVGNRKGGWSRIIRTSEDEQGAERAKDLDEQRTGEAGKRKNVETGIGRNWKSRRRGTARMEEEKGRRRGGLQEEWGT